MLSCPIHKLNKNRIDFGFIENNASANGDTYNCLIISTKQHSIICEQAGCTIEPLNPSGSQTAVVWKKASSNALVNSFSDLLLSNQAAINAEYVKYKILSYCDIIKSGKTNYVKSSDFCKKSQ